MNLNCTNCKQEIDVSSIEIGGRAVCPVCEGELTVALPIVPAPPPQPPSPLTYLPQTNGGVQTTLGVIAAGFAAFELQLGNGLHYFSLGVLTAAVMVTGSQIVNRLERILRELVLARIDRENSTK